MLPADRMHEPRRPIFGLLSLIIPLLAFCSCSTLSGDPSKFETGGDPHAHTGAAAIVLVAGAVIGFCAALTALIRRESWIGLAITGLVLTSPVILFIAIFAGMMVIKLLHH